MDYESFEPEQDEYYDEACSAAYSLIFAERGWQYATDESDIRQLHCDNACS